MPANSSWDLIQRLKGYGSTQTVAQPVVALTLFHFVQVTVLWHFTRSLAHCAERRVNSVSSCGLAVSSYTADRENISPRPHAEPRLVPNVRRPEPHTYGAQCTIW
jgi:hypothetical protein